MNIIDGVLQPQGLYKMTPNKSGALAAPTLIVMHYTAGGAGAADWLCRPEAQASAHVVLERNGELRQICPFTLRAWHAGASSWRGRSGCNAYSIGIEIANWGPCDMRADGQFYNYAGGPMHPETLVGPMEHKNGGRARYWEAYPQDQLEALDALTRLLIATYPSITDIAGHDDVAPQNKIDPGPAFPMQRYRSLLNPRGVDEPIVEQRKVIAGVLNVRDGPGTHFAVVGQLERGAVVRVLRDGGDWSEVEREGLRGFVFDAYLQ